MEAFVRRWQEDTSYRLLVQAVLSLVLNLAYAFYNGLLGVLHASAVFGASSLYYILLCAMRFLAVLVQRRGRGQRAAQTVIGMLLMALSLVFQGMIFLSLKHQTAAQYGTIPMITIATFTFGKITSAVLAAIGHRKETGLVLAVDRIRFAQVALSLLNLQQSMLLSFGEGEEYAALILNACTGAAVCIFVFTLGVLTLKRRKQNG